jgi:hypothetical protein
MSDTPLTRGASTLPAGSENGPVEVSEAMTLRPGSWLFEVERLSWPASAAAVASLLRACGARIAGRTTALDVPEHVDVEAVVLSWKPEAPEPPATWGPAIRVLLDVVNTSLGPDRGRTSQVSFLVGLGQEVLASGSGLLKFATSP